MKDQHSFTNVHIFPELFSRTMEYYKISGKELSQVSGISENHISEFRRGKRKTGVSTGVLWQLLEGMEKIAPGARSYFAALLAGVDQKQEIETLDTKVEEAFNVAQLSQMMDKNMDLVTKAIHYLPSNGKAEIISAIAQSIRLTTLKEA
jgi:transcriptional regulator with XRE-family HTH domain